MCRARAHAARRRSRAVRARAGHPVSVLLLALLPTPLAAQEVSGARADSAELPAQEQPAAELPAIIVRVTRTEQAIDRLPYAITVLEKDQLQLGERGASVEEALRSVPGVIAQNRSHYALGDRLAIRGVGGRAQFGVRGIEVISDGIPLTMADGQATLETIDLDALGRLEVLRGPASSLFGNAAGGVLSFTTEDFWSTSIGAAPQLVVGSYGYVKANLKLSGSGERFGYLVNGSGVRSDGFRHFSHADLYRANLVTRFDPGASSELRVVGSLVRVPFAENPGSLDSATARDTPRRARALNVEQGTGKEITQGQAGAAWIHDMGSGRLHISGWGLGRDVWNPIPARIVDLSRLAGGVRAQLAATSTLAGAPLRALFGLDADLQHDDRKEFVNEGVPTPGGSAQAGTLELDQDERVGSLGPFLEAEVELGRRWRLTAGGRYDWYSFDVDDGFLADGDDSGRRNFGHFSPMLGVQFTPATWINLYSSFATAFQTPTASELSNLPDGGGGLNPDLGPEDLRSFEAGVKGVLNAATLAYDVALYTARVDDALVPFQGPTEEVFFRNAGRVSRKGAEVRLRWLPFAGFETIGAFTLQDFRFDQFVVDGEDFSGNREPGVPERFAFLGLGYTAPVGLRIEVDFRWVDGYFVNDGNTDRNWAWETIDLRAMADLLIGTVRFQPYVGVDNLFNDRYNGSVIPNAFGGRYYEPAPDRQLYAGVTVGLGPGAPASF